MERKVLACLLVIAVLLIGAFAASAQTVNVTIPNSGGATGASISIPIMVSDVSGLDIFSYNLTLTFDQTVLDATGVTVVGALTEGWGAPTLSDTDGQIVIAGAGATALTGTGALVYINFTVLGGIGSHCDLTFTEMTFNEGTPAATATGGTFAVAKLFEDWNIATTGAHRGVGVCPLSGRVYISNTTNRRINYFNAGNETGTPDGYILNTGWDAWLGPYGLDVADDGMVYVTTYGATKSIFRITPTGEVTNIKTVGENMRALTVYGGGVNTVIYTLENSGKVFKLTTDGTTWTMTTLFTIGNTENASIAVSPDGNTIYTNGYGTAIHKWDAAGNPDAAFNQSPASCIAVRLSEDGSRLFAMYNAVVGGNSSSYLGELDPATGAMIESIIVGPLGVSPTYNVVNAFDILDDRDFFWASAGQYRGKAHDASVTVPNRPPYAVAGTDQLVEIYTEVTLNGSGSVDIDLDPITYAWTQLSGPTATLSDPTAASPTFTPNATGQYVFQLVVNDGALDSPADQVTITVFEKDFSANFNVDGDRNRDLPNWGIFSVTSRYSTPEWDSTGGVGGSGALRVRDGGWGFAIERKLNATPGTNFKLTADVLVHGTDVPLYFRVSGLTVENVDVQIQTNNTNFGSIELTGITVNGTGYLQILGETAGGADTVWVDNIVFDDDATLNTYTLSGKVTLSDLPTDMSGANVLVVQAEKSAVTDTLGNYSVNGLIAGTYDVKFSKLNYKDLVQENVEMLGDVILDVTLQRNLPPVADAGVDNLSAQAATYVVLDGSGSSDPDNDSLTYKWTSADPSVIMVTSLTNPIAGFRPSEINDYKFYLVVNDGTEDSAKDSVLVSVTMEAPAPLGYEFVDKFAYVYAALGVACDPEGKIWVGCYSYGSEKNLAVWNADGTRPDWQPVMSGLVGDQTVTTAGNCYCVEVDFDGNIYFSNATEHVVMKFDYKDGTPLGGVRLAAGSPIMSVDQNGYLFVGTVTGDTVWVYDKDFNFVSKSYVTYIARDIEISPDGTVLLVGQFSGTVTRFEGTPATGYVAIDDLPGPFASSDGLGATTNISYDKYGALWVTEEHTTWPQKDFIHIYTPDLVTRETLLPNEAAPWDNPRGTTFDHTLGDSLFYQVDFGSNNPWIQRWAISGTSLPPTYYSIPEVAAVDTNGYPLLSDKKVRVKGIITVAGEFGVTGPAYIQDAMDSIGVAIYDGSKVLIDSVKIGDEVVVSGYVDFYNGLTEISPVDEFTILSSGNIVEPMLITCADLGDVVGERFQSALVKIENVHTDETTFPSNANILFSDKTGIATMRIDKDTDIPGVAVQADSFDVVGVITQFDSQSPYWGGYQIMPRSKGDIPKATGVNENADGLPRIFALFQNYPNPFNPVTTIKYDLPKDCLVEIQIFNVLGQKVRTLVSAPQQAGHQLILWNGLNDSGVSVATGTYIYKIKAADFVETKRMTLIK
ncbi:MAG: PKD domain-containing protein [Candidatus Zhuqueibacterota bacterium]